MAEIPHAPNTFQQEILRPALFSPLASPKIPFTPPLVTMIGDVKIKLLDGWVSLAVRQGEVYQESGLVIFFFFPVFVFSGSHLNICVPPPHFILEFSGFLLTTYYFIGWLCELCEDREYFSLLCATPVCGT